MLEQLNLSLQEASYRHLFETMPLGVLYLDSEGRVTDANPAAERILGCNIGEMQGRSLGEQGLRVVRENGELVSEEEMPFTAALRTGERVRGALIGVFNPRRRQYRWVSVDVVPQLRGGDDQLSVVYVALSDVTEHRRVREQLREGEARFRLLAENSTDLISRHAADGKFLYASPAARNLLGYDPDDLVGCGFDPFVHPDDRAAISRAHRHLLLGVGDGAHVYRFRCRDGTYRWFETTTRAVMDAESGEVLEIQAASRDVTARREAEDALRKLSVAVEQSPASVVITDVEGRIEYVNPKFEQLTGYALAEVLGRNPRFLKSGNVPVQTYQKLWSTLRSGREWRGEFHNRRKNGELFWEWAVVSPVKDERGRVTHFLAVKEDITERKDAEEIRYRLEAQLRESQKLDAFGQLAGGVAHDFNNILTVINSHAFLLQDGELTESERAESVREIARSAERATNLTAQLLAFSRRQVLQPRELDLNDVLGAMTRMLERLIGEHIDLEESACPQGAPVHADAGMMEQVILNLAVNARDAMPKGGRLRVGTRCVALTEEAAATRSGARAGEFVCLVVEDTGSGIASEDLQRVFEPFFTTKEIGKGTGLGLSTVLGIVKQHQGWIEVESRVGEGTVFSVYLPRLKAAARTSERLPTVDRVPGGKECILVVEDEDPLRMLVRTVLERQGYQVLEAANGRQALEIWEQQKDRIKLLLTDMVMPEGMSGVELAQLLQRADAKLKVVFTTGYTEQDFGTGSRCRGNRFLPKPYDPMQLAGTVRECLDGKVEEMVEAGS